MYKLPSAVNKLLFIILNFNSDMTSALYTNSQTNNNLILDEHNKKTIQKNKKVYQCKDDAVKRDTKFNWKV